MLMADFVMKLLKIFLIVIFSLTIVIIAYLELLTFRVHPTHAAGSHYVSKTCASAPLPCYLTIQEAIDAVAEGDVIQIASGVYSTVNDYGGQTQIAYINKTVTIQGGYAAGFSEPPDPEANRTILDAEGNGRGLYITGEISPTIAGVHITGGNAIDGGGIYVITATAHLKDNWVYSNTSTSFGGGLYVIGGAIIEASSITTNTASSGGGGILVAAGGVLPNLGVAQLRKNVVAGNSACYGAGLDLAFSTAVITANKISNNSAIYCGYDGSGIGGGVLLDQRSDALLVNNMIFDNKAAIAGSGLYISGSSPQFLHNTIVRNSGGNGSGIHVEDRFGVFSTASFTNTILVSHTIAITVAANNTATLANTLWFGNVINTTGVGALVTGTTNFTGHPAFIEPEAGNYYLSFLSDAIDKGIDAGITVDLEGQQRDAKPDLGADEVFKASVYIPTILKNWNGSGL